MIALLGLGVALVGAPSPPTAAKSFTVLVRPVGKTPRSPRWSLPDVQAELQRLFRPAGIEPRLAAGRPLAIHPSLWDLDGNGRLDLWRGAREASPEESALRKVLRDSGMIFPQVALFQDSLRLGWPVRGPVRTGDTLLQLASSTMLPWRDRSGRTVRYSLEGPRGERRDPFAIADYPAAGFRIRASGPRGGWRHDHPSVDLVVRPDVGVPAFGSTDGQDPSSASLVFLEAGAMGDALRCARVLAHELGHAMGLSDTSAPDNLMSAVMHMDVETPTLTPGQAAAIIRRLSSLTNGEPVSPVP
ncbi:MAG TPA: hypothetical protein VN931_06760 [Fibrobacteria bacterium]|nr:hypothetical protein [Fibrobacteria bacterium]